MLVNGMLPVGPFSNWLDEQIKKYGIEKICLYTGLNKRDAFRYRTDGSKYIRVDTVDRVLSNDGRYSIHDLYPDF